MRIKVDLKNSNYKVITNEGAKCGFCNKNLKPIGLDYLYVNYDKNMIEYERCNCEKAIQFWKEFDLEQEEKQRQEKNRKIINNIYKDNYMKKRLQKYNFENFSDTYKEKNVINQLIKFTDSCIKSEMKNGLIIYGNIGYEKTYLAACIANKMIEQNKIALMEKSSSIIDRIKASFNKEGLSETQIIELYSNVDMLIIDDFGNENLSKWALEKLYKIISNRYDNELPIVITTRYNKEQLIEQLSTENDTEIAEEIVKVLNEMCYGIAITEERKTKEKVSISDQTIC
jgi:DNA replication protein DnaC